MQILGRLKAFLCSAVNSIQIYKVHNKALFIFFSQALKIYVVVSYRSFPCLFSIVLHNQ